MAEFFVRVRTYQRPFQGKQATVYVKEGQFFRDQGGLKDDWGKTWERVDAPSLHDARLQAYANAGCKPPYWLTRSMDEEQTNG